MKQQYYTASKLKKDLNYTLDFNQFIKLDTQISTKQYQNNIPVKSQMKSEIKNQNMIQKIKQQEEQYSDISNHLSNSSFDFQQVKKIKSTIKINKEKKRISKISKQEHIDSNQLSKESIRKVRTPVSQEKIQMMEHLFPYIYNREPYKGTQITLKDVARIVNLGYSTILHKYKIFRNQGNVQKGLLLKCKDFKRKYHKSMAMQNYIKQAMLNDKFRTAYQLADYIKNKYNVNCNRSIVSRHLNQMQRDKYEIYGQNEHLFLHEVQTKQDINNLPSLFKFKQVFFGLKQNLKKFEYFCMIRMHYYEEQGILKLVNKKTNQNEKNYYVLNLLLTCTESYIINYQIQLITPLIKNEFSFQKLQQQIFFNTYQSHYNYIDHKLIQQIFITPQHTNMHFSNQKQKQNVYIVFPFNDSIKQQQIRKQIYEKVLEYRINLLIMPLIIKNINFIDKWFTSQVFQSEIKSIKFNSIQDVKKFINQSMKKKQSKLKNYALFMIENIKTIA